MTSRRHRARTRLPVSFLVLLWAGVAGAQPFAYVTNSGDDNVSVIDAGAGEVVATVAVGRSPHGVAVAPDGRRVYVTNAADASLSVIDAATLGVVATIAVGTGPRGVAVAPEGSRVYVTNSAAGTMSVVDAAAGEVVATVMIGAFHHPEGVVVTPDGSRVFVANPEEGVVSVIDTAAGAVIATIDPPGSPVGLAMAPDGTRVYATSLPGGAVVVIHVATLQVVSIIGLGGFGGSGVAAAPDGSRIYVSHDNSVLAIDTASEAILGTIAVSSPVGVAVTPNGSLVYAASFAGDSVTVIDAATFSAVETIAVGERPVAFGRFIGPACVPDATTLCLNGGRFRVEVEWATAAGTGAGKVVPGGTGDSSNLWFFSPNNWELLIKVLDGCAINSRFWVFFAATTDVELTVTVTDTWTGEARQYFNPLGHPADAVTDTDAFAVCP